MLSTLRGRGAAAVLLALGASAMAAAPARASVSLDFTGPNQEIGGTGGNGGTYVEDAFKITEGSTGLGIDNNRLGDFGWGGTFTLTQIDNSPFELTSFDVIQRYGNNGTVTVKGFDADNAQVATMSFDYGSAVSTVDLPDAFTNLTRATFQNSTDPFFDNIIVSPINAVPEPASLGVLALASVALLRRRRRA